MRPEDLDMIKSEVHLPADLTLILSQLILRTNALQRVVAELVGEIPPCPCGDNDGMHCSLEGCPYPQPKPKAKLEASLPIKPVGSPSNRPGIKHDKLRDLLLAALSEENGVIWVKAGMRTGKTTLAKALASTLGLSSPTALMVPYKVEDAPKFTELLVGPSGLRRKPRRYVVIDELEHMAPSPEGGVVELAEYNVKPYPDGKVIVFSSESPPASRNIIYATSI